MFKKLVIGLLSLTLVGCASGTTGEAVENKQEEKITITHKYGEVEVPLNPQRVVALDMGILDVLDQIGVGESIVGMPKSTIVAHLQSYVDNEAIENLGSLKEVDMEALYASKPDVIFVGGRLKDQIEELSKIAPVVYSGIDYELGYMNSMSQNAKMIASIFEKEEKLNEMLTDFNTRIETLKTFASGKNALLGMVSSGSVNILGDKTRGSLIVDEIGFENLGTDVSSTHGDSSSFEFLLDRNPEYIFVIDRDAAIGKSGSKSAKEVLENEIVMKTKAYQSNNIIYLSSDAWYLAEGGLFATNRMIQDVEKIME